MKKLVIYLILGAFAAHLIVLAQDYMAQKDSTAERPVFTSAQTNNIVAAPAPLRVAAKNLAANAADSVEGISVSEIIRLTNVERARAGLAALAENPNLDNSADEKLADMEDKQYFEHISPDGANLVDLVKAARYEYIILGENLALGNFQNSSALVRAWMESPGHRANILNSNYSDIGVSAERVIYGGREVWMAVQHFGMPQSACPGVNSDIKAEIEINTTKINDMENSIGEGLLATVVNSVNPFAEIKISQYKKLVAETNNLIAEYNSQVKMFNDCLNSSK